MSKQDRQGVRKASDVERKYNLQRMQERLAILEKEVKLLKEKLNNQ